MERLRQKWGSSTAMVLGKVDSVLQHNSERSLDKELVSPLYISQPLATRRAQHCSSKGCPLEGHFSEEREQ